MKNIAGSKRTGYSRGVGVIYLAAGISRRLQPLTYKTNKCLLEIGGLTLLEHFLNALDSFPEIIDVHIVLGHCGDQIKKKIGRRYGGVRINYLFNPFYSITGAAQSLWLARDMLLKNRCLIVEGDHFLDKILLEKLIRSPYENCLLVDDKQSPAYGEETVVVGSSGVVKKLAWDASGDLSRIKLNTPKSHIIGEAVFVIKLGRRASKACALELEKYLLESGPSRKEIPEVLNRIFKRYRAHYISTDGLPWIEIDFLKDLKMARQQIYPRIYKKGRK